MRTCSLVKVKFCIRASWEGDDFERNSAKYGTSDSRLFHLLRCSKTSTETAREFLLQVRQNMTKKEPRNVRAPSFAISTIRRRTQQCIVSIHVQFACHSILYINARALLGSLCDLRSLESRGKKIAYNLHHQHTGYVIFILSKKKKVATVDSNLCPTGAVTALQASALTTMLLSHCATVTSYNRCLVQLLPRAAVTLCNCCIVQLLPG